MQEIYKDIPWYEWLYKISSSWIVQSSNKKEAKKVRKDKDGYIIINLYKWDWWKTHKLHRLLAQSFIPNPDNKSQVNHKNWIKHDNSLLNLEWVTWSENQRHRYDVLKMQWPNTWYVWVKNKRSKRVSQYTLDWTFIETFNCVKDVTRKLWYKQWPISSCARWERPSKYGFIWKYV